VIETMLPCSPEVFPPCDVIVEDSVGVDKIPGQFLRIPPSEFPNKIIAKFSAEKNI